MVFFSGSTTMDALIDRIADDLIATGAWASADASLVAGTSPAKRALQHLTDSNFFVMLDRVVSTSVGCNFNEVRIRLSTGFDAVLHAPSGTIRTSGIPAEAWQTGYNAGGGWWSGAPAGGSGNKTGTVYLWTDASGFTGMVSWTANGGIDYAVLFSLERSTAKEYADGYTNFFFISVSNTNPNLDSNSSSPAGLARYYGNVNNPGGQTDLGRAVYIRPFNFEDYNTQDGNAFEDSVIRFFKAYKSPGNSKVYFQFPWFCNSNVVNQRTPIAQSKRWFWCQEVTGGLADGDLVNVVVGAETWTYLVKLLQSPDSTAYIPYAIRQA